MADYDDIPTLKENIDRATVDSVRSRFAPTRSRAR
mgnify:CR=1 FL=1